MANWKFSLSFAFLLILSCTTSKQDPLKYSAVQEAFSELSERQSRNPATGQATFFPLQMGAKFSDLRGSHEIVFFLKESGVTKKTSENEAPDYMRPVVFTVTAERLLSCEKLIRENSSKWNHQKYFDAVVVTGMDCAILRMEQSDPKPRAALRRYQDLVFSRIYIDSNYRLHGVDYALSENRKTESIKGRKWDPTENPSSLLWAQPLDLPTYARPGESIEASNFLTEDSYVRNQLEKNKVSLCHTGKTTEYKDLLGNLKKVFWCPNQPWPAIVETSQYLAVWKR